MSGNRPCYFRSMDKWDRRDEPVLLLVDYRETGEFALGDADLSVTIGHNSDHNVPPNEAQGWQFAGWDNSHECYTQGKGLPIGWKPLPEASFETPWRWWAGRSEDEYGLSGPCKSREEAISVAYGDTEPGDTIYVVEAREGEREPGEEDELIPFAEMRNYGREIRNADNSVPTFRDWLSEMIHHARWTPDALDPKAAEILENVRARYDDGRGCAD